MAAPAPPTNMDLALRWRKIINDIDKYEPVFPLQSLLSEQEHKKMCMEWKHLIKSKLHLDFEKPTVENLRKIEMMEEMVASLLHG